MILRRRELTNGDESIYHENKKGSSRLNTLCPANRGHKKPVVYVVAMGLVLWSGRQVDKNLVASQFMFFLKIDVVMHI